MVSIATAALSRYKDEISETDCESMIMVTHDAFAQFAVPSILFERKIKRSITDSLSRFKVTRGSEVAP